ncbi:MAG: SLC13 family permease [Bacteriovoracaceae bacterium]
MKNIDRILFIAGPVLFLLVLLLPLPLDLPQKNLAAIMALTVSWWLAPKIALPVTGLIAICLCSIMGVASFQDALKGFANPVIFLFMGGFFMAEAIHRHKVDQWIAEKCLSAHLVNGSPKRVMIMIAFLTAGFSAFLSNTATAAMFMPIAISLFHHLKVDKNHPSSGLLLLIAYAATIGGIATPIGTPPNVIAISLLEKLVGTRIGFVQWMALMVPTALIVMVALILLFRKELNLLPSHTGMTKKPSPLTSNQKKVLVVMAMTMVLWILPSLASLGLGEHHEFSRLLLSRLPEGMVGVFMGTLLFFIPNGEGSQLLSWSDAQRIDWGTLILFGAGISLGELVFQTKLAAVIGSHLPFTILPFVLALLLLIALTVFGSELVSNTAIANLLIPLTVATPPFDSQGVIPVLAVALGSSLAFMMPVGTPPNAIAYGTGLVPLKSMLKKGIWLNLISIGTILLMSLLYFKILVK